MYDEKLANAILERLHERFPDHEDPKNLYDFLHPQFPNVPQQEWLKALEALFQTDMIKGVPLRGQSSVLEDMTNITISPQGRNEVVRVIRPKKMQAFLRSLYDAVSGCEEATISPMQFLEKGVESGLSNDGVGRVIRLLLSAGLITRKPASESIVLTHKGVLEIEKQAERTSSDASGAPQEHAHLKKVFVVHGHNREMKESISEFLKELGLKPIILHEQPNKGRTVIEKFEANSDVSFAVVLLSPDDVGALASSPRELKKRARQNVMLELGYFIGKLGRSRVCALHLEDVEIPSDINGVIYVPYDADGGWRGKLATEIREAGIGSDLNREVPNSAKSLTVGEFSAASEREADDMPRLRFLEARQLSLQRTGNGVVIEKKGEQEEFVGIVASFKNFPRGIGKKTPRAVSVTARLSFSVEGSPDVHVGHGVWLDYYENSVDFGSGDVRKLLVSAFLGQPSTFENHHTSKFKFRPGMTMNPPRQVRVPGERGQVEIILVDGFHVTLFHEFFDYDFVRRQMSLRLRSPT